MSTPNKNLQQNNKLIIILGPTASGKSEIALRLALRLRSGQAKKFGIKGAEIISADSRQIYKEMDIGTAKLCQVQKSKVKSRKSDTKTKTLPHILPLPYSGGGDKEGVGKFRPIIIKEIPHYLIDIVKPNEKFSVAEYKELAIKIIHDIHSREKIPILAGGTGLYISSIVDNIEIPRVMPNLKLRKKLEKTSPAKLLKQLKKLDPATFNTIDKKNIRRIIRALEVTISTGKPFSAQRAKGEPLFDCLQIGLDVPREKLYKKIDQRVDKMIKIGLVNETKKLIKKYSYKIPSMSGIGYKEIRMYLRGEITLEKASELIKFATHSYARRQLTWFRKDKRIKWIKLDNKNSFNKVIKLCKKLINKKTNRNYF